MSDAITRDAVVDRTLRVVHILSGDRWAGAEVQAFTLLKGISAQADVQVILLNEGELAARCRSQGLETTVLDENTLSGWSLLKRITAKLKSFRPDVVHTHRQKENVLGSIANLLAGRAKCVRTVHGAAEFTPTARQKLQIIGDRMCGRFLQDAVIAVSPDLKRTLAETFPTTRLKVIVNGINAEEVRAGLCCPDFRQEYPDAVHLGLVGRLEPVKRVDLFVNMAAILLRENDNIPWVFHVFGDGSCKESGRTLARDLGVLRHITFHGHRSDIRSCITGLDAVVMPSDHEGMPMAALETLALGKPLIAHRVGGLVDLLSDDGNFLVREQIPEAYAERVCDIILNRKTPGPLHPMFLSSHNNDEVLALYRSLQSES